MRNSILLKELNELVEPIVIQLGYELYYIEYIREQGENFLRIYIDKENGISMEDCETVSRRVSDMLDEKDPIPDSYYLEVSSPGIERTLYNDNHLKKYINHVVMVKLSKIFKGKRAYEGDLISFNDESVEVNIENENVAIPREKIKKIILKGEF